MTNPLGVYNLFSRTTCAQKIVKGKRLFQQCSCISHASLENHPTSSKLLLRFSKYSSLQTYTNFHTAMGET